MPAAAPDQCRLTATRPWRLKPVPEDVVAELAHDLHLSPVGARILALRGVCDAAQAQHWLARRLGDLLKPELMTGMERAARRLARAIRDREAILIHGDYDVDGSTSSALLALFVRACSHHAEVFIPHRRIDGYGLGEASLEAVKQHQARLMITVDCGIADHGWAARIEAATGADVIITDHHLPQAQEPQCHAVVNPNQRGCTYPDKRLAGVGVAWKLAWATATVLCGSDKVTDRLRTFLMDALALVAVGTVADCAELMGENRILVHHGLAALGRTALPGLRALLEHAKVEDAPAPGDVSWRLAPLLNASGRVGSAMANIRLLTAGTLDEARAALAPIITENEERKRLTQILSRDLIAEADRPEQRARHTLVFAGEGWHAGVVGIVASRLVEHAGKPAVVIAIGDGIGKGSLRTIPQIHLGDAIDACRCHLIKGGGHAMAAGLSIDPAHVPAFAAAFEAHVADRLPHGSLAPRTDYDADAALTDLDADFFAQLGQLGPFGTGNPEPVVQLSGVSVVSRPRLFGKEGDHLRAALGDGAAPMRELLAWRGKDLFGPFSLNGNRFHLLVRPEAGRFRGEVQQRLVFVDGRSV